MNGIIKNKVDMYKRVLSFLNEFPEIKEHPEGNKYLSRLYKIMEHINLLDKPTEIETQKFIEKIALKKSQLIECIIIIVSKLHELSKLKKDMKLKELTNINKGQLFNLLNNDFIKRVEQILFFAARNSRTLKSKEITTEYILSSRKIFDEFKTYNNLYNSFKINSKNDVDRIKPILYKTADDILIQIDLLFEEILDEEDEYYEQYIKERDLYFDFNFESDEEKQELIEIS